MSSLFHVVYGHFIIPFSINRRFAHVTDENIWTNAEIDNDSRLLTLRNGSDIVKNKYQRNRTWLRDPRAGSEEVNSFPATKNRIYYFANFSRPRHYQRTKNTKRPRPSGHGRVFPKEILLL